MSNALPTNLRRLTPNDIGRYRQAIEAERALPADQQDQQLLQRLMLTLRVAEIEHNVTPTVFGVPEEMTRNPGQFLSLQAQAGASEALHRVNAMTTAVRELTGLTDETGREQRVNVESLASDRIRLEQAAVAAGINPENLKVPQLVGGLLPDIFLGIAAPELGGRLLPVRSGQGMFGRIAGETVASGLSFAADANVDSTAWNASMGAMLGTGIGTLVELPRFIQLRLVNQAVKAMDSAENKAAQVLIDSTRMPLNLAQSAQDGRVAQMIQSIPAPVPGSAADRFHYNQINSILEGFAKFNDDLNPAQLSTRTIINEVDKAYQAHVNTITERASNRFVNRLVRPAERVGARFDEGTLLGGRPIMSVDATIETLERHLVKYRQQGVTEIAPSFIKRLDDQLNRLHEARAKGGLTVGAVQRDLQLVSDLAYGKSGLVEDALSAAQRRDSLELLHAMLDDVADTATREGTDGAVARALIQARDGYKRDIAALNELQGEAMLKVLGTAGKIDERDFIDSFYKLSGDEVLRVMRIADQAKPGLADAMRGRIFVDRLRQFTEVGPRSGAGFGANVHRIDIPGFIDDITKDPHRFAALTGATNVRQEALRDGLILVSKIAEFPAGAAKGRGAVARLEGWFINAASRDPGFLSRLIGGELAPGFFEKMLFTPRGHRIMSGIGDRTATRTTIEALVPQMIRLSLEADQELQTQRQQASRQLAEQQQQLAFGQP